MAAESAFSHDNDAGRPLLDRRDFLWSSGGGLGGIALAALLGEEAAAAEKARVRHHPPMAKRVVQLFMSGAASHLDMFDYKPELIKHHGKPSDFGEHVEAFQNGLGPWMKSPVEFKRCGPASREWGRG